MDSDITNLLVIGRPSYGGPAGYLSFCFLGDPTGPFLYIDNLSIGEEIFSQLGIEHEPIKTYEDFEKIGFIEVSKAAVYELSRKYRRSETAPATRLESL